MACHGLGICEKIRANYFLSYILREIKQEMGGKISQEMGGNFGLIFVCYADEATPRGITPKYWVFCGLFLEFIVGYFFISHYIAKKIFRLVFFAFPRRVTYMSTG